MWAFGAEEKLHRTSFGFVEILLSFVVEEDSFEIWLSYVSFRTRF